MYQDLIESNRQQDIIKQEKKKMEKDEDDKRMAYILERDQQILRKQQEL